MRLLDEEFFNFQNKLVIVFFFKKQFKFTHIIFFFSIFLSIDYDI